MKAVAFKATYNDGGAPGKLVGYRGVCSDGVMVDNTRKMTWCSQKQCACRQFVDAGLQGRRPVVGPNAGICYEASLLDPQLGFQFCSGLYHNGKRAGQMIPMTGVEPGDIALLTTKRPNDKQHERFIFGLYRIKEVVVDDWGYTAKSDDTMNMVLPDEVAQRLLFWNYFRNSDDSKMWGAGLFRYLDEEQTRKLLAGLLAFLGDRDERDQLFHALNEKVQPAYISPIDSMAHGFGGEGERHLELKMRVARDPTLIGLPRNAIAHVEYPFVSGDQVDLMFELPDGSATVVEIETDVSFPGAHQCIKYRALLEAQRGEKIGAGAVDAVLVAFTFDDRTERFADKYDVRTVRLKP